MENNRQKLLTYSGGILIVALFIALVFSRISISTNKNRLNSERQNSEKLLSQKLSTDKELTKMKTDFSSLQEKILANQKLLNENNSRIEESEKRLYSLSAENRSLRANKKELEELRKDKANLEQESFRLKSEMDYLVAQNKELQNSLSAFEKKYLTLKEENEQRINSDNFLVTATRGKKAERIVIKASRAKKLNMAFEVPQNLSDAISFKLTTPSGTTINPDDKSLSWAFPEESGNFTASLSAETGEFEQSRQVVMNYMPHGKLTKGEYKIQIFCGEKNIGNCRILLK